MLIAATDAGVALMAQLTPVNASTSGLPAGLTQNSLDAVKWAQGLGKVPLRLCLSLGCE